MTAIYTTTHDGNTATRKSAGHTAQIYTHAVWTRRPGDAAWTCSAYCSRPDLAQARAGEYGRHGGFETAIAPVSCEIKLTKRQREWQAARMQEADDHLRAEAN